MMRIGVTGVPGAGKTSLARGLASACRRIDKLKRVELVSEYARRYISKHGDISDMWEQFRILEKQREWEDSVSSTKLDLMISDSPIFLGFIYCMELPKDSTKSVMCFNDVFKAMLKLNSPKSRYDIIFHLPPVVTPVDDGVRKQEYFKEDVRSVMNEKIKVTIRDLFPPIIYKEITEIDLNKRIEQCIEEIELYGTV
jgi:nicotinamide riboside kinase